MNNKIMIVDDELDILTSLKTIFEKQNYEVITVENGHDCINEIENGFKGVILMDIMMPEMSGWDTIREIVKRDLMKGISIEMITGKGTKDRQEIFDLGSYIKDYITKPFDVEKLISSVKNCNMFYLRETKKHNN